MDEFNRRYIQSITDLKNYYEELPLIKNEEYFFELAMKYVEDEPGQYYVALPGIILPICSK